MTLRLLTIIFYPVVLIALISPIIVIVTMSMRFTGRRLLATFAWLFIATQSFYIWMWATVVRQVVR